eukprot:gene15892-biopygen23234
MSGSYNQPSQVPLEARIIAHSITRDSRAKQHSRQSKQGKARPASITRDILANLAPPSTLTNLLAPLGNKSPTYDQSIRHVVGATKFHAPSAPFPLCSPRGTGPLH